MANISHAGFEITGKEDDVRAFIKSLEYNHHMYDTTIFSVEYSSDECTISGAGEFTCPMMYYLYSDRSNKNQFSFDTEVEHYNVCVELNAVEYINGIAEYYKSDRGNTTAVEYKGKDYIGIVEESKVNPEWCKVVDIRDLPEEIINTRFYDENLPDWIKELADNM